MESIQSIWFRIKFNYSQSLFVSRININRTGSFNNLCLKLQNKQFTSITTKLLSNLKGFVDSIMPGNNLLSKINSRVFLSFIIVHKYPEEILNKHPLSVTLYDMSNKIVKRLTSGTSPDVWDLFILSKMIDKYCHSFHTWKNIDKKEIIHELAFRYVELQKIYDDLQMENPDGNILSTIENIHIQQEKIQTEISKFGGEELLQKQLDNYQQTKDKMSQVMKDSFWEIFSKDVQEKKYQCILNILQEIMDTIRVMIPNRQDLHLQIKENIDLELMEQMIDNEIIEGTYIHKMVNYIVNLCKKLDSVEKENIYDSLLEEINGDFEKGFEYHVFFTKVFRKIMENLEDIKNKTTAFKNSQVYKKLIENT